MAFEFIQTRPDQDRYPLVTEIVESLLSGSETHGLGGGVIYYGWPKYSDYESNNHYADLALVTESKGVFFLRVLQTYEPRHVTEVAESIAQVAASAEAQMLRSPKLRGRNRKLKVNVSVAILAPGSIDIEDAGVDVYPSKHALMRFLEDSDVSRLGVEEISEIRSILEGAKALVRTNKRLVSNPETQPLAAALTALEEEIASFDAKQRQVALFGFGGPQRIRGLAGSGKTIILAMKAALAHLANPNAKILITYYTRSLKAQLEKLITRFYRHFGDGEPNWKNVHVYHGWGRIDLAGVYREACLRSNFQPLNFAAAQGGRSREESAFGYACRQLVVNRKIEPFYDTILIDEGQDFPDSFYELCFFLAKGERDNKQIIWAYDELQNIFDVNVRSPEELFGDDVDGNPRMSLKRAIPPHAETNDFLLPKCYRNQREVLVLAHAIGFGIYGQPVQMLQNKAHWEDVGYEVAVGDMTPGTSVDIIRPVYNSPTRLSTPENVPLVSVHPFRTFDEEVEFCALEFKKFLDGGLQPEDLMAIAIDDRSARAYLDKLATKLASMGIASNNILADRYGEPPFFIEGKSTLSTVYRAKGNEAAVVVVLGCDAIPLAFRNGRNKLFTAFTRSKGWLRISGLDPKFIQLSSEITKALELAPRMQFTMPDWRTIELIQRDLSEKDAKIQRAQAEIERMKEVLGLTNEDIKGIISRGTDNGKI